MADRCSDSDHPASRALHAPLLSDDPSPRQRRALLDRARALKMARSVHAYVRGNTAQFYRWLAVSDAAGAIPQGPAIWICGDCHLGNLGPLADAERHVDVQIRDLDQTVVGNPALDLIRLGLSLETAARSSDLPGLATARMIDAMASGYARALAGPGELEVTPEPDVVRMVRRRATGRHWRHLARERIEDEQPRIPLGKRFWPLAARERESIEALFADAEVHERALALAGLGAKGRLRVVDAAYWKKGCSSLGKLRYCVLLGVVKDKTAGERFALIDIKEAVASVAPRAPSVKMPADPAHRVLAGACALAPNLGERMIAAHMLGRSVVLRELAPQDMKLEVEQFAQGEAASAAAYLAFIVGRAHARQLDAESRRGWRGQVMEKNGRAPVWLWRAIVESAGAHEAGYLDHCRDLAERAA